MKISRSSVLRRIRPYLWDSRWPAILLLLTGLAAVPVGLISPRFIQILVDDVMRRRMFSLFGVVAAGMLSVYAIRTLLGALNLFGGNRLLNRFTWRLRMEIWEKYNRLPFSSLEKMEIGDLKMRIMDDVDCLGGFLKEQVVDFLVALLTAGITLTLLLVIEPLMTLLCLLTIPFVFFINFLIGNGTRKVNEDIRDINETYYTSTHESLQFWKEIKAQSVEPAIIKRFHRFREKLAALGYRWIRFWLFSEVFGDFKANYLTKVLVYIIGAFFVLQGKMTVGSVIMFGEYFSMLFSSLDSINAKNVALRVNAPYYTRIFETLTMKAESEEDKMDTSVEGNMDISHVSFGYTEGRKILRDISLSVEKGDYMAIVGHSGCGKTTLAKLLLGVYPPDEGLIFLNGNSIADISKKSLYARIGVVMQDSYLFDMSIRDNLRLARENAADDELLLACRRADIADFVLSLPAGLDTLIGEGGVKLSGGQKQRLVIAQALLKEPAILIFDEATNSLDQESENIIHQSINALACDTTVLVVSHKPATILRARRVAVMREGQIVAVGTHEELFRGEPYYRQLMTTCGSHK